MDEKFPRELTAPERELLLWVLPDDRPGYHEYRILLGQWLVAAQGRRGEGNYILAPAGERIDNDSPLPQLFAYGVVETESGELSVCVRERLDNQLEYEILSLRGNVDPAKLREVRRWTFSTWLPGTACPHGGNTVREVQMRTDDGRTLVLAVCDEDQRLWVYDEQSGINHPIPVTNFYNELMLQKNIRDPRIALDAKRLFQDLNSYTDRDLTLAFRTYNKLRMKVVLQGNIVVEEPKPTFLGRLKAVFGAGKTR